MTTKEIVLEEFERQEKRYAQVLKELKDDPNVSDEMYDRAREMRAEMIDFQIKILKTVMKAQIDERRSN